jgi:hypothetical protein
MTVKLTDKVYTEAGNPVQGAIAQAILTNGTTTAVQATDTTDTKGVWAFDSSIAGHQADLPDPATGYWYDVKLNIGMQYRLRYGAIKAMMSMIYLAQNIVLGAAQVFDASLATLRIPARTTDPGGPAAGQVELRTDTKLFRYYDGTGWQDTSPTTHGHTADALSAGTTVNTGVNYTVAAGVTTVFCTAGVTVTLPTAVTTTRAITVVAVTGNSTVNATVGQVYGGSTNTTTGAVTNGLVAQGDAFTYRPDTANWRAS